MPSTVGDDDARLYAIVHDGTPGDLDFYRRVCSGARSVLELGCGAGRVLEALAHDVPRRVGLDRDPGLLALAAERLPPSVDLVRSDMQAFELGERFDRIIVPHSGLFCLLDDESLGACLRCARRHLAPGGTLAFDVYETAGLHERADADDFEPDDLVFVKWVELDGRRFDVFERSTWDPRTQRIDATYVHVSEDGSPPIELTIAQRYLSREQLEDALARAGFEVTELHTRFGPSGDDIIAIVAELGGTRAPAT